MLRQHLQTLSLATRGEGFINITAALDAEIAASGLQQGLASLVCLHTSCSLTVNENADPQVLEDLAAYLLALVPQEGVRPISGRGELRRRRHAWRWRSCGNGPRRCTGTRTCSRRARPQALAGKTESRLRLG